VLISQGEFTGELVLKYYFTTSRRILFLLYCIPFQLIGILNNGIMCSMLLIALIQCYIDIFWTKHRELSKKNINFFFKKFSLKK